MSALARALLDIEVGRPLRLNWDSSLHHTLNPLLEMRVTAPDCMEDTNNQGGMRRSCPSTALYVLRAILTLLGSHSHDTDASFQPLLHSIRQIASRHSVISSVCEDGPSPPRQGGISCLAVPVP
ncbi:unnamed protein product [Cercospora beticola]|nr:unnamed protein product [Cercospora beticola]